MIFGKKKKRIEGLEEISIDDVKSYLDFMVECGLIEVTGYTTSGEPRYSITTLGRMELDMQGML